MTNKDNPTENKYLITPIFYDLLYYGLHMPPHDI